MRRKGVKTVANIENFDISLAFPLWKSCENKRGVRMPHQPPQLQLWDHAAEETFLYKVSHDSLVIDGPGTGAIV